MADFWDTLQSFIIYFFLHKQAWKFWFYIFSQEDLEEDQTFFLNKC